MVLPQNTIVFELGLFCKIDVQCRLSEKHCFLPTLLVVASFLYTIG